MSGALPGPPGGTIPAQGRHPTVPPTPEVILEENALLVGDLDGSLGSLTLLGSGMPGSIGVALAATRISGLMPFGPAFQSGQLQVGDEVLAIDGVEVTSGTVVNAMTGEQDSDIQIQVRRPQGEVKKIDLVRTSSAKLLIAHNLAQHLHTLYKNFDTSTTPTGETEVIRKPDIELQKIVSTCIGLLQDLQDQVSRTETAGRNRLRQAQQKMFVQIKQLQDNQHRLREAVSRALSSAREKAVAERDQTMSHLMSSQEALTVLEPQLARTLASLAEKQASLEAASSERKVLIEEIAMLKLKLEQADARQQELERFAGDVSREKMGDQEKMLNERLKSLEQHQARVSDLEEQAAELEAENETLGQALEEAGMGHLRGENQRDRASQGIVAKLKQEIIELKKDLSAYTEMLGSEDQLVKVAKLKQEIIELKQDLSAYTEKFRSQDQLIKELSASVQNGKEVVDLAPELDKAKILNSVYEERLREQTRELQTARSLAAAHEERLKAQQENQAQRESEALRKAKTDLAELQTRLSVLEPQAARLKTLEEENAELRTLQELAKKKEASYVSKIGELDREVSPNGNFLPGAPMRAAPPPPQDPPRLPVPIAITSLASAAPPRPMGPPAPRTAAAAPPPLSPTMVPRTRPDQPPHSLPGQPLKAEPPRPAGLPSATRSPPQPGVSSGPSVWASAAKNFERQASPSTSQTGSAAPPPPPRPRPPSTAPSRGASSSSNFSQASPPTQGQGQGQGRSVYSANSVSASSLKPARSLPGSRSTSPSHNLSASPILGPGMVLYSSSNSDGYGVNQQISNGPGYPMMHPGQAYMPNMGPVRPAAARDQAAAWVQSMQHQNGLVVAMSRGNLR